MDNIFKYVVKFPLNREIYGAGNKAIVSADNGAKNKVG